MALLLTSSPYITEQNIIKNVTQPYQNENLNMNNTEKDPRDLTCSWKYLLGEEKHLRISGHVQDLDKKLNT